MIEAREKEFFASIEPLTQGAHKTEADLAYAEAALKAMTVVAYQNDPEHNKQPAPGVGIRVSTVYDYDAKAMLPWCKERQLALIPEQVDTKALDKLIKSGAVAVPGVTASEKITATIATDLSDLALRSSA